MANKTFEGITTAMTILLALCFVLSVTAASVNAATFEQGNKFYDHDGKYKHDDNYRQGYKDGDNRGLNDGKEDCIQYGSKDFSGRFLIPPTETKDTEKASSKATLLATMRKDTYA